MLSKQEIKNRLLETNLFNDDKYLDKYCEICSKNDSNTQYIEGHHIFPKTLSRFLHQEVDNSENNFVVLSYRNHIKAHIYLALACKDNNEMFFKFTYAVNMCIQASSINNQKIDLRNQLLKNLLAIKEFELLKEKKYQVDKGFYDECNKCKTLAEHDRKFNFSKGYSAVRYIHCCERYKWFNHFPLAWTQFEDKQFYDECNKYKSLTEHEQKFNLPYGYSQQRYKRICKEYGYINMFAHAWTKSECKQFYDDCNECNSLGEHDRLNNLRIGYSSTRYHRIIKKYKWKNAFTDKHYKPDKFSMAENKLFYDECNKCKTLAEHDRKFGLTTDYSKTRYKIICKKYKWVNKFIHAWDKKKCKQFYKECNECNSLQEHDRKFDHKIGYSCNMYRKICKKYRWPNKFAIN